LTTSSDIALHGFSVIAELLVKYVSV